MVRYGALGSRAAPEECRDVRLSPSNHALTLRNARTLVALAAGVAVVYGTVRGSASLPTGSDAPADQLLTVSGSPFAAAKQNFDSLDLSKQHKQCGASEDQDDILIYKYTIATSNAFEDGAFAENILGCKADEVLDGCTDALSVYKMDCFPSTMAFGLHFPQNGITKAGKKTVTYWDKYQTELNIDSFTHDRFNEFMHYSLAFYVPDLTTIMSHYLTTSKPFLARKGTSPHDGQTYFTMVVHSPTGKVYEFTSTRLSETVRSHAEIRAWQTDECPSCHFSQTYTRDELDEWYYALVANETFTTSPEGIPIMMPVRNNIAVNSLETAKGWFGAFIESLSFNVQAGLDETGGLNCSMMTANVSTLELTDYKMEVRFTQNQEAYSREHSVGDFIGYIDSVSKTWTGENSGWSAWYDRHLGLEFVNCPLDNYMLDFAAHNVSFHAHGRSNTSDEGWLREHCWTEGVQGYGIEMQGNFSYTFQSRYSTFDFCTWDTNPSSSPTSQGGFA